jgi:hypothetical protein
MNSKRFDSILFKTGEKFLQYILNYNKPFSRFIPIEDYSFQSKQIKALDRLSILIDKCENEAKDNPNTSLKHYLFRLGNEFNKMRELCGGEIRKRTSKEELLQYLIEKAIEFYSCLLISENNSLFSIPSSIYFPLTLAESKYIHSSLSKHPHFKNITTSENVKMISYKLSNNSFVNSFVNTFVGEFILRCFLNCCYRLKYTLDYLLDEIENQYLGLENIARGETIKASFFCGISGVRLDGVAEYNLTENITLRNIDEKGNPGITRTVSTTNISKDSNVILGCTLEYKTELKSDGKINIADYSYTENAEWLEEIFDNLINSHLLGLHSVYPPLKITFVDKGFPLAKQYPKIIENFVVGVTILKQNDLANIKEWFTLLRSVNINYISITLVRIRAAIYSRQNSIDSILDAFIAWESMFSSEISTANSVINSIAKMLERAKYKISKTRLNDLYSLRSSIVHGNPAEHKLLINKKSVHPSSHREEIKKQTIDIALTVLKELLKDKDLFERTPEERVKHLLNPASTECKNCHTQKYKFE